MARANIRVADEVWVATALLHQQHPEREDFTVSEITHRAAEESSGGSGPLRPGFVVHVSQHCVASKAPNPGRYRMLIETERGRRRLFRPSDPYHPDRRGGKTVPRDEEIPWAYRALIGWYHSEYVGPATIPIPVDPILSLLEVGKSLRATEAADTLVRRLRESSR